MIIGYDPIKADEFFAPQEEPQYIDYEELENIADYLGNIAYDSWKERQL